MYPLKGKRVLITGGTGSLGQVLVRRLLERRDGPARQDRRLLARRGQAARHARGLPAPARRHRRGHLPQLPRAARVPHRRRARLPQRRLGAARRRRGLQRRRAQAGADLRVLPLRGRHDQHRRPREHRARDPGARAAGRDGGRHLHRQGLQAGQRHGHDQGHPGARVHPGQHALPQHALRLRALRQRAGLARLGDPAVPRADPQRRSGDHHDHRHDPLPAQPRPGGRHGLRGALRSAARRDLHPARALGPRRRHRREPDRRPPDQDRGHRHPPGREGARDPGLRRRVPPHRRPRALLRHPADAARAARRAGGGAEALAGRVQLGRRRHERASRSTSS